MKRDQKHWETDIQHKNEALETAGGKCKLMEQEQGVLKSRLEELEEEILEREACEAKV